MNSNNLLQPSSAMTTTNTKFGNTLTTPMSPVFTSDASGSGGSALSQLQPGLAASLNPESSDSMLFYATQALDRQNKLLQFVDTFKFNITEYVKSLQSSKKSLDPIDEAVSTLDVRDHRELQSFLSLIHHASVQTAHQNVVMQERLERLKSKDLDTFEKSWKLIRDFTQQYVKSTKKTIKKRKKQPPSKNDQVRDIKENRGLKKKIYEGMDEMRSILEEYVHTQLFYHSKCLEMWACVWEEAHRNRKDEVARRKEEDEEEDERLSQLLKETSSVLAQQ
ncbi:hypothetical protein C9374_012377 [Naegleria lovaniensis]|uniref:Uncharacterized protein n=1 Tax=Naegleria lovaniensis TaxID=51637 RepID=A0AA88KVV0_NAELO|nr:uncharacterized protein C9374_012377 [Naegleria lovaniensis]KAG2392125.1 hypothetical protein C9374_012377 [Naegleria lovaniensis]